MAANTMFRRTMMAALLLAGAAMQASTPANAASHPSRKPTIVLVHGAFGDSTSWNGVIAELGLAGFHVVTVANPLRSLQSDASYVSSLLRTMDGPVVLVGHSYGGSVITNAATGNGNVKALVYVAGFAPDTGESVLDLLGEFPGSLIPTSLEEPVALPDGTHDLYLQPADYARVLAADVPAWDVALLSVTQRPVTDAALAGQSGSPAWKGIPSWFVYGSADMAIPPTLHQFMARRAGAREVLVVPGASHYLLISHPGAVARVIEDAASATAG